MNKLIFLVELIKNVHLVACWILKTKILIYDDIVIVLMFCTQHMTSNFLMKLFLSEFQPWAIHFYDRQLFQNLSSYWEKRKKEKIKHINIFVLFTKTYQSQESPLLSSSSLPRKNIGVEGVVQTLFCMVERMAFWVNVFYWLLC